MSSAFRITQRTLTTSTLSNLQSNLAKMQRLQEQMSSGRSLQRPSDSPTGTVSSLRLRTDVRRSEQLARNAQDGLGWLGTADTTLTDGIGMIRQARELVLSGVNAALGSREREAMATEIEAIRNGLLGVANTTYLKQPLFAGTATPAAAYDAAGAYQGDSGQMTRTVAPGLKVAINLPGEVVFGPAGNDVFKVLGDVADHLRNNPSALATTDLDAIDGAFLRIQNALSTVGSRYHQVETMSQRTDANRIDATNQLSEVEGVDLPATIVAVQLQEVAYQAALGATAKVIQPSLLDFLR